MMIKNQRQYDTTRAQIARFEAALARFDSDRADSDIHPLLIAAEREGLESQLHDLRDELREYEALQRGDRMVLQLTTLSELPAALIRARIAAGLSQRELADRLGWKEQQVQRYEATDYAGASLTRIQEVMEALGMGMLEEVLLPNALSFTSLGKAVGPLGITPEFVRRRLITGAPRQRDAASALSALSNLSRVFGISPAELYGEAPTRFNVAVAAGGRFKVSAGAHPERLSAYAIYAHYLALLAIRTTEHLTPRPIPTDASAVRRAILERYGSLDLTSALSYVWDLGIPVLPLNDPGAFHGACFRAQGRNAIVLKQRSESLDRWLFDLFHELRHAGEAPDEPERDVIEIATAPLETKTSPEEATCNQFAGDVILGGMAEVLTQKVVSRGRNYVPSFKSVVPEVAREAGVPVGGLSNYVAVRLDMSGVNWWGAASNLQAKGDPWGTARDIFLMRADLAALSPPDRDLLMQALTNIETDNSDDDE